MLKPRTIQGHAWVTVGELGQVLADRDPRPQPAAVRLGPLPPRVHKFEPPFLHGVRHAALLERDPQQLARLELGVLPHFAPGVARVFRAPLAAPLAHEDVGVDLVQALRDLIPGGAERRGETIVRLGTRRNPPS